jgi:hypothetical protein
MANRDISFDIKLDNRARQFFQGAPGKLKDARKRAVEAMGMVWADTAKGITRAEDHIDTGLYINSIGYGTGSPSSPLYDLTESRDKTELKIGANVEYAESLEKRYAIMARGLDNGKNRMARVAETQVKNTLGL